MVANKKGALQGLEKRLGQIPGMSALIEEEYAVLIEEEKAAAQIAELVKHTRTSFGLSQTALGKKLGVTQARVSKIEQGAVAFGPSIGMLARVALACGRTLQLSFGIADPTESKRIKAAPVSSKRIKTAAKVVSKRNKKAAA